ncbi:MAG: hypothetical protein KGJ80_17025 [Chloroflexota bacterium]|nr:hypothetical protein [Chloroflexota bacterium]
MKKYLAHAIIALALCTLVLVLSTPAYAENAAWTLSDGNGLKVQAAPAVSGSGSMPNRSSHDALFAPPPPNVHQLASLSASGNTSPGSTRGAEIAALAASLAPSYRQTSEFMLGKVAVGIVMPQCTGTIDKCSETWNQTATNQVASQIQSAMTWWSNRMNGQVTFVFDQRPQTPTGYEPIKHSQLDESLWIGDTMTHMGFSGSTYSEQVYGYDNWMRAQYGADWAFTIFVANSLNNPSGTFSNGYDDYAYVRGPFMVMTYSNANYAAANMAAIAAHETGHIFGALDEYPGAGVACTQTSGYLTVQNQNSDLGCALNLPSIMRGGTAPYFSNQVDPFALAMVGNRISSGPLPDPINTKPIVLLDPITSNSANPTITGIAQDQPFNPLNGSGITINYITGVQYRVDGQAWQNAAPSGGDASFNQVAEGFAFTPTLTNGTHAIDVQAINRVNHSSNIVSASVTVQGASPQPTTVPPTPTPLPSVPTATPLPPVPTATPLPPVPTATPLPPVPTATPLPPVPTATLNPTAVAPTAVPTIPAPVGALLIQINAGKNALSLPYAAYTASTLIAAINAQGGSATEVDNWNGTGWNAYKAGGGGDFNIDAGTGYIVKANSPSSWTVPLSAGSPLGSIKLDRGWDMLGVPPCKNGTVSCYTASTLAAEINSQGGGVAEIDRMVNGSWSAYFVGYSSADFPIVVGQGYFVRSTKSTNWTAQR